LLTIPIGEEQKYIHRYTSVKEICDAFPNKGKAPILNIIQKMIATDDIQEKRLGASDKKNKQNLEHDQKKLGGILGSYERN